MTDNIEQIIEAAYEKRASDIHIAAGLNIKCRIDGNLSDFAEDILTDEDCIRLASQLTPRYKEMEEIGELDFAYSTQSNIRCRANIYRKRGSMAVALRLLNNRIPTMQELGLPPVIKQTIVPKQGLVFITGQTGSGKSTTLAYLIDEINRTQSKHVITLEDPIEYLHESKMSMISQREIGTDTRSLFDGMKSALREDPDVVMIGELRTMNEIEIALTLAETGHLVFASVHTNSAAKTIDRIVDVFPPEQRPQIRMQLSLSLNAVISQQLLPHASGKGRVLATEVMMMTPAIRNLIREGDTPQIANAIATGASLGSCLMDNNLVTLFRQNRISREQLYVAAHDIAYINRFVR